MTSSSPLSLHITVPHSRTIVRHNRQRLIDEMIHEMKSEEKDEEKVAVKIETQDENSPIQNSSSKTVHSSSHIIVTRNGTKKPKRRRRLYSTTKTKRSSNRTKTNLNKIKNNDDQESEKILKNINDDDAYTSKSTDGDDENIDVKRNDNLQPNGVVDNGHVKKCDTTLIKQKSSHRMTKRPPTITTTNNVITNYFPIVSRRLLAAKLKEEEYNQRIIECITKQIDPFDYLAITEFRSKGKAIIAKAPIRKGSFICEYSGDLIDLDSAKKRELKYEQNQAGCYMYYFNWNSTIWCVDATKPTGRLGRLINHSRKSPNCKTKIFEYQQRPHLIFIALRDIEQDEEILYDYGERDPMAIKSHPWLTTT